MSKKLNKYEKLIAGGPVPYEKSNGGKAKAKEGAKARVMPAKGNAASYDGYPFKIYKPKCVNGESQLSVSFRFQDRTGDKAERIAFQKAVFRNINGKEYASDEKLELMNFKGAQTQVERLIDVSQKQNLQKAFLEIFFCSTEGIKYIVVFRIDVPDKGILYEIKTCAMSEEEKEELKELLIKPPPPLPPVLKRYLDALDKEKSFLMMGGGKNIR